jgi:lipid II:glycine glycyltransferase (peptidoglycan interpeptide bridge formation enzyme)
MKNGLTVATCNVQEYVAALADLRGPEQPVSFLQAPFYGAWQQRDGKTVVYFKATQDDTIIAAGLAIKYDAPGGISFLYCPYGPVAKTWTPELLTAFQEFFTDVAQQTGATFVRLDHDKLTALPSAHAVPNYLAVTASLQPRAEWLLDISGEQDAIWMGFHKHARYNVRLAERANASVAFYAPADAPIETFFKLMQTTAGRDSFSIQSRDYYQAVLSSIPADSGFVAICTIDGKPAAAGLFAAYDGVMHYVFAGSSNNFRKIAPPYLLIWQAILEAKKRGWHTLNFGGVSDAVKGTHLAGVTGFKTRFGGYRVIHLNPVDLVYKPLRYTAFRLYKRLRG